MIREGGEERQEEERRSGGGGAGKEGTMEKHRICFPILILIFY